MDHGRIGPVESLIDSLKRNLNPQQYQAVTAGDGPVLILAGPGSGKTWVLMYRITYLVNVQNVKPYRILALTFTNKAAREIEARFERLAESGILAEKPTPTMGTFHAVCAQILRREAGPAKLPFTSDFVIFDADDQVNLVKQALKDLNIDEKQFRAQAVHAAISAAKNETLLPESFKEPKSQNYKDKVIGRVYEHYQKLLLANNAVDFDDLLLWVWRLLKENEAVRDKYAQRFEYILVDEFQDTNRVQYELLRLLTEVHKNIFVVGDEDQSIYRWRGADYRNVLSFERDYPNVHKILLEHNYRSTQTVLDVATAVINRNINRTPKRLRTDRGIGEKIVLYEAHDDHAEAAYVVETIQELTQRGRAKLGDFAVMYRTNAQSRLVEEAFLHAGMDYRLVGAQRFYGRREVKDLIAYLRLVQNPADELSLNRVINVPPRGIGDKTLLALRLAAQQHDTTPGAALLELGRLGRESSFWAALPRGAAPLADFGALLASWREHLDTMPLPELFNRILEDTAYYEYIHDGTEEGQSRWENVQELFRLTHEYEDRGLPAFLEKLALVSDQDTVPEGAEAPTLLTLHAAKGLEFPIVFIVGLDDGVLPHIRSLDDPEEMAEERRLFYVGITRAKNRLYLVRADERNTYGSFQESVPSRFLGDIPEELLKVEGYRRRSGGMRASRSTRWNNTTPLRDEPYSSASRGERKGSGGTRWGSDSTRSPHSYTTPPPPGGPAPVVEPSYKAGMRVRHALWNEGLVIESRIQDGEEIITVAFESVGFKRLVASLANLEILKK